jgi:hypothetical protein
MADLRVLTTRPQDIAEDVLAILEEALERAKKGEVKAVAIAEVCHDGSTVHSWSKGDGLSALQGAIFRMLYRLNVVTDDC